MTAAWRTALEVLGSDEEMEAEGKCYSRTTIVVALDIHEVSVSACFFAVLVDGAIQLSRKRRLSKTKKKTTRVTLNSRHI